MSNERKIQTAVLKLSGQFKADTVTMFTGNVVSYDEEAATCVVEIQDGVSLVDVQLQAGVCDGLLMLPAEGSTVQVIGSKYIPPYVSLYSDIVKVYLQVGDSSMTLWDKSQPDGSIIQLMDGSFGGLAKVAALTDKYNALENKVNDMLAILKGTVIPLAPSGTYPFAPLYSTVNPLVPTTETEIENPLVTHGR